MRFIPHRPRRYTERQMELRLKELNIMAFAIGVGLVATVADAMLN